MNNLSKYRDEETANTKSSIAEQRARNLFNLNKKNVLELCVGPSLRVLEQAYSKVGLTVTGNDIDKRWQNHYPSGKWIMGDCFGVEMITFDVVVFAPPLSKGCSGKREDALMIEQVNPGYYSFLKKFENDNINSAVLVLPARSIATKEDRKQYHKLLDFLYRKNYVTKTVEMFDTAKSKHIRKYVDIYLSKG